MRISHRHAVLAATAALLLSPGCSRPVATSAVVNPDGTICVGHDRETWFSKGTVPGVDPARTTGVEGTFQTTDEDVGMFTPAGSTNPISVRRSPHVGDPRVQGGCAIR